MSSTRKYSCIWMHFMEDGRTRAKCNYCQASLSIAGGSNGNLSRHMKKKHSHIVLDPEKHKTEPEEFLNEDAISALPSSSAQSVRQKIVKNNCSIMNSAITDTMSSRSYKSASAPPSHMATRTTDWSCGNVSFCFQAQRRVYVLNCMFCSQVCLHWDSFINHMEQEHDEDLCSEHLMQKEPPAVNIEHDYRIATKRRKTNTSNTSDNNRDGDDRLSNKADFNSDPLIATHDVTRFPENVSIKTESAMEIIDEYEDTNTISDKEDEASVTYEDEADITTDEQTANSYKAQTTATKSDVQALMDKLDLAHRLIYRLLDEVKSLKGQTSTTATNTPTVTSSRKNRQFERGDDFLQCDQKRSPDQRFMGFITEQQNL
ncbi:uncharacterized protein LOC106083822 isoform X1 [Stomoxys calcitrans]|uniref:BED-type domain-containing protein n=1 Tax=Stomoxys calcitrans TaxID=35570 RepID=A0A1I8PMG1_STOCA|nr:uncharacterized protein LOC106083822 isoform X1 [Stomoxys calcitrans]